MSEKYTGGAAFPVPENYSGSCRGMELRDYFAAAALQGFIAGSDGAIAVRSVAVAMNVDQVDAAAKVAYSFADAMLRAREG